MHTKQVSQIELDIILSKVKSQPSADIESDKIEFKNYDNEKSLHNSKDLAEEISALANHCGGAIIIGVIDSSNVTSGEWDKQLNGFVRVDLTETKFRLTGKLSPMIDLHLEHYEFESKNYLVIHIPHFRDKLIATKSGKVCIRDGRSSRPMTPEEIEEKVKSLQFYDWSNEIIDISPNEVLDETSVEESLINYCGRRGIATDDLTVDSYLESISVTKDGVLNRAGLLFLGKDEGIKKYLGDYEYRFSRKKRSGSLIANEIWRGNLWKSTKKFKSLFEKFNNFVEVELKGKKYKCPLLDKVAFHEALLNAIVHRDYTEDGMIAINFKDDEFNITNPGTFYGGVTENNIVYHEPRHRNKALASILMLFSLVDRAGMGVLRMGVNSLRYGRAFPMFKEEDSSIEVSMEAEYLHAEVFVIANDNTDSLGIVDLLILNMINQEGYTNIDAVLNKIKNKITNPWESILYAIERGPLKDILEFCGNKSGLFIRPNKSWNNYFHSKRTIKTTSSSSKHIKLYKHLKAHSIDSNENLMAVTGIKHSSTMSSFLKECEYLRKEGKSVTSKWLLLN